MAMPAADVTACCSAMPTSRNRSGNRSWNGMSPVEPGMAAVYDVFRDRIAQLQTDSPPEDWDGVYVAHEK